MSFMDDYNRWMHFELIVCKSDVLTAYKAYEAWLNTQHDAKLKKLQTDY